jgi:hypothetical protein
MKGLTVISNPALVGEKSEPLISQISQSPEGMPMAEDSFEIAFNFLHQVIHIE